MPDMLLGVAMHIPMPCHARHAVRCCDAYPHAMSCKHMGALTSTLSAVSSRKASGSPGRWSESLGLLGAKQDSFEDMEPMRPA